MSIIKILSIKNFIKKNHKNEKRDEVIFTFFMDSNNTIKFKFCKMNEIFK